MQQPMDMMTVIFLHKLVVEVVVTVVEIITTTTRKSQYFQSLQDFSGRSGRNFNFSGKIENVRDIFSIKKLKYKL